MDEQTVCQENNYWRFFYFSFLKVSQENYWNKIPNSIFQAADGGSSTSESSLGSSSGYGSQSTVRPEDQHNLHQPTLTAVHDGMKTFLFLPLIFIFFMWFQSVFTYSMVLEVFETIMNVAFLIILRTEVRGDFNIHGTKYF